MTWPDAMSLIQAEEDQTQASPQQPSIERRSRVRFPFELQVRYRTLGRRYSLTGSGWVVNMSSGGVLVAYRHEIPLGTRMELNIEWPSLLDGRVPLRLVTVGRVVRSEPHSFAVSLNRHQFRTTKRAVIPIDRSFSNAD
jgi:PilZ domain